MSNECETFMRALEARYRAATSLLDRSQYKIFYGPVRQAQILLLGINPGGDPASFMPDGVHHKVGANIGAASASYYENDESDLLDCNWHENTGLLKLLVPLLDGDREAIRTQVVKTNMAFRRSRKVGRNIEQYKTETASFLLEIINVVRPSLVLLTGVKLEDFSQRFTNHCDPVGETIRDEKIKMTVFRAAQVGLRHNGGCALAVQLTHASQWSWTYERYGVVDRIRSLQTANSGSRVCR
jgi:hypothetical protein